MKIYFYYKSFITNEYVVMFENPRCGAVEDGRFKTENEAIKRVSSLSGRYYVCPCPAATNLWCVWDKVDKRYIYANIYKAECLTKCTEFYNKLFESHRDGLWEDFRAGRISADDLADELSEIESESLR